MQVNYKDIAEEKNEGALQKTLRKLREELTKLYKEKMGGTLKDTSQIKKVKASIARVLTRLNKLKKNKDAKEKV